MKMIIRNSNGGIKEEDISSDMKFTPTEGEHIYFTGVKAYQFQLIDDNDTMNVYFMTNEDVQINIVLNKMAEFIEQNDPLDPFSVDTIFGVSTNEEGDKKIDEALNNKEFESAEIIEALKEALSLDGSTVAGGAVIDDFQSMLDNMAASAANAELLNIPFVFLDGQTQNGIESDNENNGVRAANPLELQDTAFFNDGTRYERIRISHSIDDEIIQNVLEEIPTQSTPIVIPTVDTDEIVIPELIPELEPISEPIPEPEVELERISEPIPEPEVELEQIPELTSTTLSITGITQVDEGEDATYQVSVTQAPFNDMIVNVTLTDVTTNGDVFLETIQVTIPAGETTSTPFNISNVDDNIKEDPENYNVAITEYTDGGFDEVSVSNPDVTTTITDNSNSVTVRLVSTDIDGNIIDPVTIPEGETAYYKTILVDETGNQIVGATGDVDITFTDGTAVRTGNSDDATFDFTATNATVTLNEVFSAVANDDYLSDNAETFNVQITDDTYTNATLYENVIHNTTPVVTTISDDAGTPNTPTDGVEDNHEVVLIKLIACDTDGNPILIDGNYTFENSANEGENAHYVAFAFNNNETVFNETSKLDIQTGKVDITFNNDSAIGEDTTQTKIDGSEDFNNKSQTISIGESFSTNIFNDILNEGSENYTVTIDNNSYTTDTINSGYENVAIDTNPVITTIDDSTTPMKVFVKIEPITDTVNESENLEYKVSLVDVDGNEVNVPTGKSITVDLIYTNDTTEDNDYTKSITTVTITGGSSTNFTVPTLDDYFAEGDEDLKIKIDNISGDTTVFEEVVLHTIVNGVSSDKVEVDGTIKDNPANVKKTTDEGNTDNPTTGSYDEEDTVYVKISETPSTIEGWDLVHTVTLVDKDGNDVKVPAGESVTVDLTYTVNSGDFTESDLSTIVKTVTIVGGTNHKDFTNTSIDNFTTEGDEVYTVTITDVSQTGAFENVVIATDDLNITNASNHTTGTIVDGVILGDPVNAKVYEDALNTSATTEDDLGKSLGITNPNNDTYTVSFNTDITTTDKTSNGNAITYSYNTDGTILTATRADDNEVVFTVELKKDGSGNDVYDFKLETVMDHAYGNNGKNEFDMPFSFNVTSNGTTSSNKTFNVTVVDSVPSADPIIANTKEDTEIVVRLADDYFKDGEQVTINGATHNIGATGIAIYEKGDATKQIGSLTINTNGTVTFTPVEDYSNHDTSKSPEFTYTVKDFDGDEATSLVTINVKPVADTPSITLSTPEMVEDNANANEGAAQVALELTKPTLSKDQTDENSAAGDHVERNGEITLTFTNGDKVTGAKIFESDGTTQVGSEITTANQTLKVVIVTTSGDSNTIDYAYHHADITASNPSGNVVYLTETEYRDLKIQHAEDNDTNIKIKIDATSYELDDSDKPLSTTDADLYETATANMIVKINPATDDISLAWDTATDGSISTTTNTNDTFTFTNTQEEGYYFNNPIDLDAILSNTSGGLFGTGGTKADLDGSEKRTYTVSDIPEGTVIIVGTQTAVANASGIATLVFNNTNNKDADPEFAMKLPEQYSGTISNAKITLSVQDKGVDSGDEPSSIKTAEVYFNVEIGAVADDVTLNVAQAVGDEDTDIALNINVYSDDNKDIAGNSGSTLDEKETYNVTISAIPDDAVIVYNGTTLTVENGSVTIDKFDNNAPLKITPPLNSDENFDLKVSAVSQDGNSTSAEKSLTLNVTVNDVADGVNEVELNKVDSDGVENTDTTQNIYQVVTTEEEADTKGISLADIYESITLEDTDGSESLSLIITGLAKGYEIEGATYLNGEDENRVWVVSQDGLDRVTVTTPDHYSGEVDLNIGYVTTEKAGDSLTQKDVADLTPVKILVTPDAADTTITNSMNINEDALTAIDFAIATTTDGSESLQSIIIDASSIGDDFTLYYKEVNGDFTKITSDTTYTDDNWENIYAQFDADLGTSSNNTFNFDYTILDTLDNTDGTTSLGETITSEKTSSGTYTLNLSAVTDEIFIDVDGINNIVGDNVTTTVDTTDSTKEVVSINDYGTFSVNVDINALTSDGNDDTSKDTDDSETISYLQIEGVPDGVSIEGATFGKMADGTNVWYVDVTENFTDENAGNIKETLTFKVSDGLVGTIDDQYSITITAYNQDGEEAAIEKAITEIILIDKIGAGTGDPQTPDEIDATMTINEFNVTEDTNFTLADIITITPDDKRTDEAYSITFKNLENVSVSEDSHIYTYIDTNGDTNYVVNVPVGGDIASTLGGIELIPSLNFNENNDGGNAVKIGSITMMGYVPGSSSTTPAQVTESFADEDVTPVTDTPTLSITPDDVDEDNTSKTFDIKIDTVDDPDYSVVGNVSMTFDSSSTISGGNIKFANGDSITVTDGIEIIIPSDQLEGITFTPNANESGEANFTYSVTTQETGATNTETATGILTIDVNPVVDGLDLTDLAVNGTEYTTVAGVESGDEYIELKIGTDSFSDATLIDTDGSEEVVSILLDDLPVGFTVYYGDSSSPTMATNAGLNANGANTWNIPVSNDGTLPNIYVKAPENWSGTLENIKLKTTVTDGADETIIDNTFTLTVDAVASDITINPTLSFNNDGGAYHWTDVNLNANMTDLDGSETLSVTIDGLDGTALFRLSSDESIVNAVFVEDNAGEGTGTWTLSGIASNEINNVQILYHDIEKTTLNISAYTVDGDDTLDTAVTDEIDLELDIDTTIDLSAETRDLTIVTSNEDTTVVGGSGNDTIIGGAGNDQIDGGSGDDIIDGGAGNDTINGDEGDDILTGGAGDDVIDGGTGYDVLDIDGDVDLTDLRNIEELDATGSNDDNLSLTAEVVKDITDEDDELVIVADNGDEITLEDGPDDSSSNDDWEESSDSSMDGFTEYTTGTTNPTITVFVDNDVDTTGL